MSYILSLSIYLALQKTSLSYPHQGAQRSYIMYIILQVLSLLHVHMSSYWSQERLYSLSARSFLNELSKYMQISNGFGSYTEKLSKYEQP